MEQIKLKIGGEPDIKLKVDGTRGDAGGAFALVDHKHEIADTNGLQSALDGKADDSHIHVSSEITDLTETVNGLIDLELDSVKADIDAIENALLNKANVVHNHDLDYSKLGHTHPISDVTNLQTILNAKSDVGHKHAIADVTNLQTNLDSKSDVSHTHDYSSVYSAINHNHNTLYAALTHNHNGVYSLINHTHDYSTVYAPLVHNHDGAYYTKAEINTKLDAKQNTLVSGNNIVTINGQTLLGSGNITIAPGITNLDGLSDVVIDANPSNGQILKFNQVSGKWVNADHTNDAVDLTANQDILTALNGQTVFTLSQEFGGVSIVSLNGISLIPTEDYSISGTELTMAFALKEADKLVVTYGFGMGGTGGSITPIDPTTFIEDNIVDGVVDKAPSQNIVYQALINKADFNHGHEILDVNGLQEALNDKASVSHNHNGVYSLIGHTHDYSGVYAPLTHNHDDRYYTETEINTLLGNKQNSLVSGTNIKTIGGQSILGSGDIVIASSEATPATQDIFTATAGQTVFTLSKTVVGAAIITLNGIQVNPSDFVINGTNLTFNYTLDVGDLVIATYGISLAGVSGGGSNPSTNSLGSEFSDSNIITLKPNFGTSQGNAVWEGVTGDTTSFSPKPLRSLLLNSYSVSDSSAYARVGGALIGSGGTGSSTSTFTSKPSHGMATGNGGYYYMHLGGFDALSNIPLTVAFMGLVGGPKNTNATADFSTVNGSFGVIGNYGIIGFGFNPGDVNLQIIIKKTSANSVVKINMGNDWPIVQYSHYKFEIIKNSLNSYVEIKVKNLLTGLTYSTTLLNDGSLPDMSEALAPYYSIRTTSGTAISYNLSFVRMAMLCGYSG